MKKLSALIPFFLLLLFFSCFISQESYAQATSPATSISASSSGDIPIGPSTTSGDSNASSFTTCPPQFPPPSSDGGTVTPTPTPSTGCPYDPSGNYITDFTQKVVVSFSGLEGDPKDYKVCFRLDHCITNPVLSQLDSTKLQQVLTSTGVDDKDLDHYNTPGKDGFNFDNFQLTVCGRGDGDLYDDVNGECDPKNGHYFHAGHFYLITIYSKQDNNIAVAQAGFYVNHGIPTIDVNPKTNISLPIKNFTVSITQNTFRNGGKNNNDYQVVLQSPGYKKEECDWISKDTPTRNFEFPLPEGNVMHYADADDPNLIKSGFTVPGKYVFKINEQINEGGLHTDDCQGGHTYEQITCNVTKDPSKSSCTKILDPNGDDASDLLNLLNTLQGNGDGALLPCNSTKGPVKNPLDCPNIDTAIGNISLDPAGFIVSLFSIVLSFAGIGALFLIIYSGYRLLISRGNKEAIQGARETITAAIVGLLFIVFSLVILSVITGNILHIPGFS